MEHWIPLPVARQRRSWVLLRYRQLQVLLFRTSTTVPFYSTWNAHFWRPVNSVITFIYFIHQITFYCGFLSPGVIICRLLLVLAITLGVAAGITLLILVACFVCPGCLLHKKRRPGIQTECDNNDVISTPYPVFSSLIKRKQTQACNTYHHSFDLAPRDAGGIDELTQRETDESLALFRFWSGIYISGSRSCAANENEWWLIAHSASTRSPCQQHVSVPPGKK